MVKYSFSAAVVQSWRALHVNLVKIALHRRYFSKNFTTGAEQHYWKMHLDGCFWGRTYFGNIPALLLLQDSCKCGLRICIIWFVWLLFGFKVSSYKSEEIELILSFKNHISHHTNFRWVIKRPTYSTRCILLQLKSRAWGEHLINPLLWATARLLVTRFIAPSTQWMKEMKTWGWSSSVWIKLVALDKTKTWVENIMRIVLAAVTKLGEIKMSAGWCFMG